ncbi:GNAT family N-acetyltransferase [Microvirga thermotolerans]|uniref:GNAT family N-acetyltransferase n=1 Tax=Microvirga thermotolerans TaxID=2651334 RepID=A0A5P9JXU1_9HYPH|nr:GNAT family N-acetyltransferase [Microvirga thermotolerans]QFU16230.1 GNAT family N-acetyltransferase [Microvirga thermotolerans]
MSRHRTASPGRPLVPAASAPIVETQRLRLRGHRADDFDASVALWSEPVTIRFIGPGRPFTREENWARLVRYVGHWSLLGYGYWAVEDRASGAFVGEVGFADFRREIEPSIDGMPEMGWVMTPEVHGRGYATEAVRAALAWGDAHFGLVPTVCLISPENLPSIRVAEKCGFRPFERTTYKDKPTVLFRREPGGV